MNHLTDQKILYVLSQEPRLTSQQLNRVVFPDETSMTSYQRLMKALNRMEKQKLVRKKPRALGESYFWYLPGTSAPNKFSYEHDEACGDLYVALRPQLQEWRHEEQSKGLRYDRKGKLFDTDFYFEVDR